MLNCYWLASLSSWVFRKGMPLFFPTKPHAPIPQLKKLNSFKLWIIPCSSTSHLPLRYDFQSKLLCKKNRQIIVNLTSACYQGKLISLETVHQTVWHLTVHEQEQRRHNLHIGLLSLIIFTVSDFHLCVVLSWASADICMKYRFILVFVAFVSHVAVCYVLWMECMCPWKPGTLWDVTIPIPE